MTPGFEQHGEADPLLSVYEVARLWGTKVADVRQLVETQQLVSIDRGLLVREGDLKTPLIRRSRAEALRHAPLAASRVLPVPPEVSVHPAVEAALAFHESFRASDARGVYDASSASAQLDRTATELLAEWAGAADGLRAARASVGTAAYSLAPIEAVAVRVTADAPVVARPAAKPALSQHVGLLPLVEEGGRWKVDLNLFLKTEDLLQRLSEPLAAAALARPATASGPS